LRDGWELFLFTGFTGGKTAETVCSVYYIGLSFFNQEIQARLIKTKLFIIYNQNSNLKSGYKLNNKIILIKIIKQNNKRTQINQVLY